MELDPEPEPAGVPPDDPRWRVPWLEPFLDVPDDAIWPRLMSVPHRAAAGSLGPEFIDWAETREGRPLRWWQRLVATRLLETDRDGRLVWSVMLLTMGRQLGKSWLLRELCLWRVHQADRFGEPQDVLHTGKDVAICKEVQRPARLWAKAHHPDYKVREVNGQEEIELVADGSRWMVRAKDAVYGYATSMGAADEAWKVRAVAIEEGLEPTMAEREQAQLLLISTAHRRATSLMLARRRAALATLEDGDGELLIEWSAPADVEVDDEQGWRLASPHWSERRRGIVARQLAAARAGDIGDPEEPDPIQSFKAQWLNQWPSKLAEPRGKAAPLLAPDVWAELERDLEPDDTAPVWVALEDDYGLGAAVAACARRDDGRLEVDGWLCADWDAAVADVRGLISTGRVRRLLVGGSLLDRLPAGVRPVPLPMSGADTRRGLALLRDLAQTGQLVHDVGRYELDNAIAVSEVKEAPTGLFLTARGPAHLVKALVWAVGAAHKPDRVPAVY